MVKLCTVAPVHILEEMHTQYYNCLGYNHLFLAHDVVQPDKVDRYKVLFERHSRHGLLIMDNSAYELKSAVDTEMVWRAVDTVGAHVAVLPDHYLDGYTTYIDVEKHMKDWYDRGHNVMRRYTVELMMLPQGDSLHAWFKCAELLNKLDPGAVYVKWWGIPRNFKEVLGASRKVAIDFVYGLNKMRRIHLFGFSNDYMDDFMSAKDPRVNSIDTTTHIRASHYEQEFNLFCHLPKRGDWWERGIFDDLAYKNLGYAHQLFGN